MLSGASPAHSTAHCSLRMARPYLGQQNAEEARVHLLRQAGQEVQQVWLKHLWVGLHQALQSRRGTCLCQDACRLEQRDVSELLEAVSIIAPACQAQQWEHDERAGILGWKRRNVQVKVPCATLSCDIQTHAQTWPSNR